MRFYVFLRVRVQTHLFGVSQYNQYYSFRCKREGEMEELMQYVWRFRLWPPREMTTVDGRRIDVIDPGTLNRNSGPDFFNAKVSIGGQMWVGNIEMHIRASDWMRHGHDSDSAYDSVVLHVVEKDDTPVHRTNGELIPQMVMRCARDFSEKYNRLVNDPVLELPCSRHFHKLPQLHVTDWLTALGHERLFSKSDRVLGLVKQLSGNWAEAIYITLARSLGFGINSEPFELLARTTPLKILLRHSDSIEAVEALLFGQAGMLASPTDDYSRHLASEYAFFSAKYGLHPSSNIVWKMARLRPSNFPHRRIAALAHLIGRGFPMSELLTQKCSTTELQTLLSVTFRGYWSTHYAFGCEAVPMQKENAESDKRDLPQLNPRAFGNQSIALIIINTIVPVAYAYGEYTGDTGRQEMAKEMLQQLKPESNSIVEIFRRSGLDADNAFVSQALIQLRKEYCVPRKCLFCRIGHKILSDSVTQQPTIQ